MPMSHSLSGPARTNPGNLPRSASPILDDEIVGGFRQIDPALQKASPPRDFGGWHGFREEVRVVGEPPPVVEELPVDLSNLSTQAPLHGPDLSEGVVPEQIGLEDDEVISKEVPQIRFRLSSRHLISASPIFKTMLMGPWEESKLQADSRHNISATDWDENAFKLLMDIVHGNSQKVPRFVDLELLAKVAVLVDYYKCYDVVKFYSDTWIEGLGKTMEITHYSRDFVLVLFVSCVFSQGTTFRDLTYQAMQKTQGPLRSLGLPFPERLIGLSLSALAYGDCFLMASAEEIERNREDTVGRLLDGFHGLLQYLTTRASCHSDCSAVLVGSLYRKMSAQGILSPRPAAPFHGFSFAAAVKMAAMRDSSPSRDVWGKKKQLNSNCSCSIGKFLGPLTKQFTNSFQGLELEKYVTNPWLNIAVSGPAV